MSSQLMLLIAASGLASASALAQNYPLVSTMQDRSYDDRGLVINPAPGQRFFGQDAQNTRRQSSYLNAPDGLTTLDEVTRLTWVRSADAVGNRNGLVTSDDKVTFAQATGRVSQMNTERFGGFSDWRLPTVKELYSLIDFRGRTGTSASNATPYINSSVFSFAYGDPSRGERHIDAQYWSSTQYTSTTMVNAATAFGVNFADGRIKGYPQTQPTPQSGGGPLRSYAIYVRGNTAYGQNAFVDNANGTITDNATDRMWSRADSSRGMNWEQSLAWVQQKNAENYLGHNDWRLPDAKQLQSLVDYSRAPGSTGSPAIDPLFQCTPIVDALGRPDFGYYWSSTTHLDGPADRAGDFAVYIGFGRGLGWMEMPPGSGQFQLLDVHGAGTQRSDPKAGNPANYPLGFGPQGDVIGINNYVRLVRTVPTPSSASVLVLAGMLAARRRRYRTTIAYEPTPIADTRPRGR